MITSSAYNILSPFLELLLKYLNNLQMTYNKYTDPPYFIQIRHLNSRQLGRESRRKERGGIILSPFIGNMIVYTDNSK